MSYIYVTDLKNHSSFEKWGSFGGGGGGGIFFVAFYFVPFFSQFSFETSL